MRPTHDRRSGEVSQGSGVSGGGPVVSLREQGRGLGSSAGRVCGQTNQGSHLTPRVLRLGDRDSLEHVLNGPADRRDRAGLAQPRAATLLEERPAGRTPGIAREKNDPLAQGRILPRQEGVEGWPVQVGHMQVTHNHVIGPLLELGQGVPAIARRLDA